MPTDEEREMQCVPTYTEDVSTLTITLARPHWQQYQNDASFHLALDQFASMLPAMIDGIAERCAIEEVHRAQLIRLIAGLPPDSVDWDKAKFQNGLLLAAPPEKRTGG